MLADRQINGWDRTQSRKKNVANWVFTEVKVKQFNGEQSLFSNDNEIIGKDYNIQREGRKGGTERREISQDPYPILYIKLIPNGL